MKKLLLILCFLLASGAVAQAQVSDSTSVDSVIVEPPLDSVSVKADTLVQEEEPTIKRINPWKNRIPNASYKITNDSLLRWNIYPNWGDFYAYRHDAISFRQGTIGRTDAYLVNGYDPYEQNIFLDDISLKNPITGLTNYNYVPHHKIGSVYEQYGSRLISNINIRDYYITEPISYLNFDEASNNYRNLEFFVSQNTSPGTNIELSYWDRRGGGFYPNSEVQGSQIMGRIYHHLNEKYKLEGLILRNDFNNDESGGYVVNDPLAFSFGEFTSQPRSSSGASEILRNDMKVGIYERSDTNSVESGGLFFTRTKNDRLVRINADTLSWELIDYGATMFKSANIGDLILTGEARGNYYNRKSGSTISEENWITSEIKVSASYSLAESISFFGNSGFSFRNTGHNSTTFGGRLLIGKKSGSNISAGVTLSGRMPTIQSLYWQSKNFTGNTSLKNEDIFSIHSAFSIPFGAWEIGGSARYKSTSDKIVFNTDSTFSNAAKQDVLFSSGFLKFENDNWEIENSVAFESELAQDFQPNEIPYNTVDTKLWIRNSLFYKTYAFSRATFLKMGLRALTSPLSYESRFYNAELGYWQNNSLSFDGSRQEFIPAFFRLDAELSARVRAIMVVIRWENALDGFGQAGYFEASSYPMPPRRLIVGIRAQFRN